MTPDYTCRVCGYSGQMKRPSIASEPWLNHDLVSCPCCASVFDRGLLNKVSPVKPQADATLRALAYAVERMQIATTDPKYSGARFVYDALLPVLQVAIKEIERVDK